jgi:hypothetical protein
MYYYNSTLSRARGCGLSHGAKLPLKNGLRGDTPEAVEF